jgi:hypothetical protein
MRRIEETLNHWLAGSKRPQKAGIVSSLREKLALNLRSRKRQGAKKAESLPFEAIAVDRYDVAPACATVKDDLVLIENPVPAAPSGENYRGETEYIARGVELIGEAGVIDLELQDKLCASIRDQMLSFTLIPRSFALSLKTTKVRAADGYLSLVPQAKDGSRLLIQDPEIPVQGYKISQLPYTRRSVRLKTLKDSEYKSFLHEAEVLKGIPANRAELLAVFRLVPIEIISRLHFIAGKRIILYSISPEFHPTSTRLHDMAAVRDAAGREVYLISHRTQFRAVSLN